MKLSQTVCFIIALMLFCTCKKEVKSNSVSCNISGVKVSASGSNISVSFNKQDDTFSLGAINLGGTMYKDIYFTCRMYQPTGSSVFALAPGSFSGWYQPFRVGFGGSYYESFLSTDSLRPSNVTITYFNGKEVKGTFSFDVRNPGIFVDSVWQSGELYSITNGVFDAFLN